MADERAELFFPSPRDELCIVDVIGQPAPCGSDRRAADRAASDGLCPFERSQQML